MTSNKSFVLDRVLFTYSTLVLLSSLLLYEEYNHCQNLLNNSYFEVGLSFFFPHTQLHEMKFAVLPYIGRHPYPTFFDPLPLVTQHLASNQDS